MRNLRQWTFTVILAAGCGVSTPADDGGELGSQDPSGQQDADAALLTAEARQCIIDGIACQVVCLEALPLTDISQIASGCQSNVNACMSDPVNARDCIEAAIRACEEQARQELAQYDLPAVQQEIAECQTTCFQTADTCVADLADNLSADTLQCANSAVADIETCVTVLNQCDYEALAEAVECDEGAYDTMADCLLDALLNQQSPTAAQACIEQMMASCNFTGLEDEPCFADLADCPTDVQDTFAACMP